MSDSSIAPQPWESTPEGLAIAEAQWHRLAAAREEPDDLAHWWIRQGPRTIVAEECPAGSSRVVVRPLARFGATALDVEVARLIVEYRERPWLLCARPRSLEEHREFLDFFSALRKVIRSDYSYRVIRGDCSSEEIPEGTFVVAAEVDDWTFRYLQQVFEEIKRIAWAKLYLSAYTLEVNDGEDMVLIDRPDAPLLDGRPFRINEFNGRLWDRAQYLDELLCQHDADTQRVKHINGDELDFRRSNLKRVKIAQRHRIVADALGFRP